MKRIQIDLNKAGYIENAIKELQFYKRTLNARLKLFVEKLADVGISVANVSVQGDSHEFDSMVAFVKEWNGNILYLVGRNDDLSKLRTEWYDSEGNYHNETVSPILALEYGTAGLKIPSKYSRVLGSTGSHSNDVEWYFYTSLDAYGRPDRETIHYATAEEPHMPMLLAYNEMKKQIKTIAKQTLIINS